MLSICKKHNREHTPSFDPSNTFCFECENEPKGSSTQSVEGSRITAAPVGIDDTEYFSVIEVKDWGGAPQYCYLFKSQKDAEKELDLRAAADHAITFAVAIVTTKVKCVQWRASGMSVPTYAIWSKQTFPSNANGNHAKMVKKVNGLDTADKRKQAKLKPKYGGSLNKGMVTPVPYPTPAAPKSTGPAPIPMPAPAKKKVVKKVVKKPVRKTGRSPALKKTPLKKATKKSVPTKKTTTSKKRTVASKPSKKKTSTRKTSSKKATTKKKYGTRTGSLRSPSRAAKGKRVVKKSSTKKSSSKPKLIKKVKG